ncbi:glycerol-3-phosphate dehydrogenase/oxidase [Galactobacter caseinivorans]|uniref:Glycerol-3-phosphate dehydrogenase/oxidase n=1 Tax=Galactobacter caseinivorans TaxID=2676123 RepID=A0A496PL76_9MICC|nr:glycerol-3-phosphate dehydrogenase/oxidase [Galactobacter caseinivorans]RKW71177.1 glycerol-3-phosphate dehydrogenase/oxidase [Galactobacter caseinivorans]
MSPQDSVTAGSLNAPAPRGGSEREVVAALKRRPRAQVLIVGGGINGVATYRDLTLQGIDVALIEAADYANGASGASSHMIHGGIRYLENGEFRLVKESVQERNRLLRLAPHYVRPLRTSVPIRSVFSGLFNAPMKFLFNYSGKPRERGAAVIEMGLTMYDLYSRAGASAPKHSFTWGRKAVAKEMPELRQDTNFLGTYYDASVHNPERLIMDLVTEGDATGHGRSANYVRAVGHNSEGSVLRDELTGEEFTFAADVVINVTGNWVDGTNEALGASTAYMGGTKGSHIVLDHPELLEATRGREIFFEHEDGRIVLIYPMLGRVLVGTTDLDAGPGDEPVATDEEIQYFFDLIKHVFPTINVTREQIVYTFCGVRPLPKHDAENPGRVSRDYKIEKRTEGGSTYFSLIGGKWTTFRALSEHLANDTLKVLGSPRRLSTEDLPIGGGKDYPEGDAAQQRYLESLRATGMTLGRAMVLLERYGTRASDVAEFIAGGEDQILKTTDELSTRELLWFAQEEQVGHTVDVFVRRTNLAFRGLVTDETITEVSEGLAAALGWDATRTKEESDFAHAVLVERHRMASLGAKL